MLASGRGDAGPILRSTSITMFVVDVEARIFDFDNHYYESEDALTRHQDRALGNRGVRWADIGGRRRLLVRSEEHTLNSSHQIISYAVFCLKKKKRQKYRRHSSCL